MRVLSHDGVKLNGVESDVLLKAYLVDANRNYKSEQELFNAYNLPDGEEAALIYYIDGIIDRELEDRNLAKLYKEVELPLVDVLFDMEEAGFKSRR